MVEGKWEKKGGKVEDASPRALHSASPHGASGGGKGQREREREREREERMES